MNLTISRKIKQWLRGLRSGANELEKNGAIAIPRKSMEDEIAPLEGGLFQQVRLQWQYGDWNSLALLKIEDLQNDPEREKLAALVAAAHQQRRNDPLAQDFLRLAKEWGCHPKYIARVLIAGAYDTLGRAAILTGQNERALSLFERAVKVCTKNADTGILAVARGEVQAKQLPSSIKLRTDNTAFVSDVEPNEFSSRKDYLKTNRANFRVKASSITNEVEKLQEDIRFIVRNEIVRSTRQLEAFINIQSYLVNGETIPELHGWPISPDIALYLIQIVSSERYDVIVEFGSGTSTYLIAKTLQKFNAINGRQTKQVAFEHLKEFHIKTLNELSSRGLGNGVDVELSPLVTYYSPDGQGYPYYSCQDYLSTLSTRMSKEYLRILVLVDGPPGSTGKHARYPAMPIMISHFPEATIDFLVDDYERSDEREVVKKWTTQISADYNFKIQEKKFEKGACLLKIERKRSVI